MALCTGGALAGAPLAVQLPVPGLPSATDNSGGHIFINAWASGQPHPAHPPNPLQTGYTDSRPLHGTGWRGRSRWRWPVCRGGGRGKKSAATFFFTDRVDLVST